MLNVTLVGDELRFRGYCVGLIVSSGIPASEMGTFIDSLDAGLLNQDERPDPCNCAHMRNCPNHKAEDASNTDNATYDEVMRDLTHNLEPLARGGLLRMTDVARIVNQLIEEKGQE